MSLPDNLYKKKKKNPYIVSILFLITVSVITVIIYLYNQEVYKDINEIEVKIKEVELLINNIKKDERLQVYNLIEKNNKSIEKLKYISQVPTFIKHFKFLWRKYKMKLKTFNYSGGKINTEVLFTNKRDLTYLRVVNFIKNYRESSDALFELNFINSVRWNEAMKFSIWLELKDKIKEGKKGLDKLDEKIKDSSNIESK